MSSALHGYMDPSSTDKGAADETDKVNLQVLCLTGEGVALSVPRSMLGYDLWRLVSEKLPCKPGAKLAMHHVNAKLRLNQTLGHRQRFPALTYQQMCTEHGVTYVGSGLARKILC